jgi:hypothetical protein
MIKMWQKWISLLLAITFMWMLHVSTMPLSARDRAEQAGPANVEQGPGFFEAISQKTDPGEKKSILPYILIGVSVAAVVAVLFLVVFKTRYDISGYWTGTETWWDISYSYRYKFGGGMKSGAFEMYNTSTFDVIANGSYVVDGKKVNWSMGDFSCAGAFDSAATIKGSTFYKGGKAGTFTLMKKALSDAMVTVPYECDIVGSWVFDFNRRGSIEHFTFVFSGNKSNGEFMAINNAWMTGTYTVVDATVTLSTKDKPDVHFSGRFNAANTMTGSWSYMSEAWNWTAHRARRK